MHENITHLNDTRGGAEWGRARGVRRRERRVVHLTVCDWTRCKSSTGERCPFHYYYKERETERRDEVLTVAIFSARDDTGGYGARSGDYW